MKYLKITGLCLAATLTLSTVAANSAFAEKPEFLFPQGGTKRQFSTIMGEGKLETQKGETTKCTGSRGGGEISGPKEARNVVFTFTECITRAGLEEYTCQSEKANTGEIKSYGLLGRIGFINKATKEVGILFSPETGKANNPRALFVEFECVNKKSGGKGISARIKGSIIGAITPINTLIEPGGTTEFAEITFKETSGKPEIKNFEGEPANKFLTLDTVTTKEKVKETGGEEGWVESGIEGRIKVYPLESVRICTE